MSIVRIKRSLTVLFTEDGEDVAKVQLDYHLRNDAVDPDVEAMGVEMPVHQETVIRGPTAFDGNSMRRLRGLVRWCDEVITEYEEEAKAKHAAEQERARAREEQDAEQVG